MSIWRRGVRASLTMALVLVTAGAGQAQAPQKPFEPTVGQAGKDVVWVPTPQIVTEKMLDMANITPKDYVIDLGSGDGRNVISAAKRGATALGVEYNPKMVELSKFLAKQAGVSDKATFIEGDMYEADISKATVLAIFLLPENMDRLTPKFLDLKPGSRIVSNTFAVDGWEADETQRVEGDCSSWCTSLLFIIPAKVAGTWRLPQGELTLTQSFQMVSGSLTSGGQTTPITSGRLRGEEIFFRAGVAEYSGRVNGNAMEGNVNSGTAEPAKWSATRAAK